MEQSMVTAVGAITSVGLDAVTTCASIRAGLSRPEEIQGAGLPEGIGHPIPITHGLTGMNRWLVLAEAALEDLCLAGDLPPPENTPFWSTTLCAVVTPVLEHRAFLMSARDDGSDAVADLLLSSLCRRVEAFCSLSRSTVWCRGRIGVLEMVQIAAEHLQHRRFERVIVLAVDSLVDDGALLWLVEQDRLEGTGLPEGLAPGEAAVAFMIEAPRAASMRRAPALARIGAVATSREGAGTPGDEHQSGPELARVMRTVLEAGEAIPPYAGETITDLNGEPWRAREYERAQSQLTSHVREGGGVKLPAACVGEVGAAMAALQVVMGCRALYRDYAVGEHVLLVASDERGHVGAALLGRA